MPNQFCPYCHQLLKKVEDVYFCPIHGRVLGEVEKAKEESDSKYIG